MASPALILILPSTSTRNTRGPPLDSPEDIGLTDDLADDAVGPKDADAVPGIPLLLGVRQVLGLLAGSEPRVRVAWGGWMGRGTGQGRAVSVWAVGGLQMALNRERGGRTHCLPRNAVRMTSSRATCLACAANIRSPSAPSPGRSLMSFWLNVRPNCGRRGGGSHERHQPCVCVCTRDRWWSGGPLSV